MIMQKKILCLMLISFILNLSFVFAESNVFETLKQNLIKDGFEPEFIEKIYSQPYSEFIPHIITINVKQAVNGANFVQYNEDAVAEKVKSYIAENNEFLSKLYEKYNVPPEIICSILMVESKLGSYMGKYRVINIYSSMAASNTDKAIDDIYERYQDDAKLTEEQKLSRENIAQRVKKKSDWAYSELKIFLKFVKDNNIDPFEIKGSFSGAFGLAQFIPSSFARFAVDGNGDGKIDLYNQYDAMASIANYLKENGWKKDLTKAQEKDVIGTYNHNKYYVDAVANIAEKIVSSKQ
ncbi:MAG: lytic murein transglycosylase [bacterium]|nr:lytic murein transglycosylase [bacterium]